MLKRRLAGLAAALAVALIAPIPPAAAAPPPTQLTCDAGRDCTGVRKWRKKPKKWRSAGPAKPASSPAVSGGKRVDPGWRVGIRCHIPGWVYEGGPVCHPPRKSKPSADPGGLRQVVAKLKLPDPTPLIGPDPAKNEWNMLAVGFPIWLWTKGPTRLSTTAKHDGLSYTLTATRTQTVFDTGDGHTKSCVATTPYYWTGNPDDPSPTCGYVYQRRSPIGKPYTIRATTHWRVDWKTGDQHGSLTTSYTGSTKLTIGELQSIIRG